jgi:hypothetical protein
MNGRQHVEHHAVSGSANALRKFIIQRDQVSGGREMDRHHADLLEISLAPELGPTLRGEARQAIDLFDQRHVTRVAIGRKAEQLRSHPLGAARILDITGSDPQSALRHEPIELGTARLVSCST